MKLTNETKNEASQLIQMSDELHKLRRRLGRYESSVYVDDIVYYLLSSAEEIIDQTAELILRISEKD